ncbi:hypothetical protein PTI98_000158 [Pleurotus ostreatus]|nr:hypothetical protein PTI98_000158 [Pleurotus ostreatus]
MNVSYYAYSHSTLLQQRIHPPYYIQNKNRPSIHHSNSSSKRSPDTCARTSTSPKPSVHPSITNSPSPKHNNTITPMPTTLTEYEYNTRSPLQTPNSISTSITQRSCAQPPHPAFPAVA